MFFFLDFENSAFSNHAVVECPVESLKKIINFLSIHNQIYVDKSISCLLTCAYLCNLLRLSVQKKIKEKTNEDSKKENSRKDIFRFYL